MFSSIKKVIVPENNQYALYDPNIGKLLNLSNTCSLCVQI